MQEKIQIHLDIDPDVVKILETFDSDGRPIDYLQASEMAQKQGHSKLFTYYTLDNEFSSHYPHVHVCTHIANSKFSGKPLRSGKPYQTIGSVKLNQVANYIPATLEFEEYKDPAILSDKYKQEICNWLNATTDSMFNNTETNAVRCIKDYIRNNDQIAPNIMQEYQSVLRQIPGYKEV